MVNISNFSQLKDDFEKQKQMILFVGAGINLSKGVDLSWDSLLNHLFSIAINHFALGRGLNKNDLEMIRYASGIRKNIWKDKDLFSGDKQLEQLDDWFVLYSFMNTEFPTTMKASIIKQILGNDYISYLQQFLYNNCNKFILSKKFWDSYSDEGEKKDERPFYSLYQLARIIILCPSIRAIVTYNYDNFLRTAIEILCEKKEHYFDEEERKIIGEKGISVKDIAGSIYDKSLTESDRFIYHVHGYIESPAENRIFDPNPIVLSLDEYNESAKNVYSWQNATQLHLLSHYTCIFAGLSLNDSTAQRMLYYARECGNDDKLYYLSAVNSKEFNGNFQNAYLLMNDMKMEFHKNNGVVPVISSDGYASLYEEFGNMVSDIMKKIKK